LGRESGSHGLDLSFDSCWSMAGTDPRRYYDCAETRQVVPSSGGADIRVLAQTMPFDSSPGGVVEKRECQIGE
jgi:hypothetical protein